jgi:octaprenyl-diphosphate synthase
MEKLAETTLRMTEGEMLQTRYVGRLDLTEEEYLDLAERKTAVLFGCCCELGGMLAGIPDEQRGRLQRYGLNLGLAFQLVDDLLDFTGNSETLGKPAASDLREGKATLAVLDLMANGPSEARDLAQRVMESGDADSPEIVQLTRLLHETGSIGRAHRKAQEYAVRAVDELSAFDDGEARQAMLALPDLLLFRDR